MRSIRASHLDAEGRHHRDGHVDVGLRHEVADQPGHQTGAHGRAAEQQAGEELAGDVAADRHLAAGQRAADHLDRQVAGRADVVHLGAEGAHARR